WLRGSDSSPARPSSDLRAHARDGALEGLGQGHEDGLKGSPGGAASVGEGAGGPHRDRMNAHADAERPEGDPARVPLTATGAIQRSEEHTSEFQSRENVV